MTKKPWEDFNMKELLGVMTKADEEGMSLKHIVSNIDVSDNGLQKTIEFLFA